MANNEHTSARIGSIASRGLHDPASLTLEEIREVCGSALTQIADKGPRLGAVADYNAMLAGAPGAHAYYNRLSDPPSLAQLLAELPEPAPNSLAALRTIWSE